MPDQTLTRRNAVKIAGAALAAPAIQSLKAANQTVSFGIIGTGSRGSYLLKHLKGIDNGHCTAVCDINPDNLQHGYDTIGTNPTKYKDYRDLLNRKDIDAVIIATPLFVHFPVTRDALLAGKHTFCEKSLVFKPEEVHALRALASQCSNQILQVGLQRRYSVFYQTVKEMVDKGVLGNVTHIQAQWNRNPGWKMKPNPDPAKQKMQNWRLYRDCSGGLAAELASHQVDVADWMFGSVPEYVVGVGGHDYIFDGRDINDNVQVIIKYPKNQKFIGTYISTNSHLAMFNSTRTEFGELIMGTEGSVEITIGDDTHPALAVWFREPAQPHVTTAGGGEKKWQAGATMVAAGSQKGFPIMMYRDEVGPNDSFVDREMKFGRRWLYTKGIATPEEPRNPVDIELESFFNNCRDGQRPKANVDVGLADSTTVILSNLAFDEGRRVYFSEMEKMGRDEKGNDSKPKHA
jgi:predicted dehydrogenase